MDDPLRSRFGRWTLLEDLGTTGPPHYIAICRWQCDCGKIKVRRRSEIVAGASKSCGCLGLERRLPSVTKHGMCKTPEYRTWQRIFQRCYNPKDKRYKHYGGRGITVCDQWRNNFPQFLIDMGKRPPTKPTIERIDNNLGYSPDNCKWATYKEQNYNHRGNHRLTANGQTKTLTEWADGLGVKCQTIIHRLKRGMPVEEAVTRPVNANYSRSAPRAKPRARPQT